MTLSPQAVQAMQMIGIPTSIFPDTTGMDEQADLLRTVAAGTSKAAEDAETTMRQTQQVYQGESGTALAGHWQQTGNSGGHLAQANAVAGSMPTALNGLSGIVKSAEALAGATAVYFTYRALMEFTRPDPSAPARATAQLLYGRHKTGKILDEVREGTGNVLTRAIKQRIITPLENMIRNMKRPGSPTPNAAGAGGHPIPLGNGSRFAESASPRGGNTLQRGGSGWRFGGNSGNVPNKALDTAEAKAREAADAGKGKAKELRAEADKQDSIAFLERGEGHRTVGDAFEGYAKKNRDEAYTEENGLKN